MRKTKNFAIGLLTVALLLGCASATSQQEATTIEPSKLDVESFINGIDTQQDISELSLSDCRILRNGFAARVGYPFRDAYLRGIFQTTTWYDSLQWVFWEDPRYIKEVEPIENEPWRDEFYRSVKDDAIKYTDEEKAFMEKLKEREEEYMFLGLRTARGVSREEFKERFGESFPGTYEKKLMDYCSRGFMEKANDRIRLTDKGIDVSNVIMADFLQD